jgi:hypothetical protein
LIVDSLVKERWPGSPRRVALFFVGVWALLFVVHSLVARWQWEQDKTVEICVDGAEIELLSDQDDPETWHTLASFKEAGVSSVSVYWDPTHPLSTLMREWAPRVPVGMGLTLRPEPVPFSDWSKRWPKGARPRLKGPPVRHILFSGAAVMGYPNLAPVKEWLADTDTLLPLVEFGRQRGMATLRDQFPTRVVRAHALLEEEMSLVSRSVVQGRFLRAVRERGARFLYVRLFPGLSMDANKEFLVSLTAALRSEGWRLGPVRGRYGEWPEPLIPLSHGLRLLLAFSVSVGLPFLAFFWAIRHPSPARAFFGLVGAALVSGLLVSAFLSTPSFTLGFSVFRGVKAALLLPLGLALFTLYRADELRHMAEEVVTVGRLVLGMAVLGAVAYFVLRIGHGTVADASPWERVVRGHLESLLGIRPRFKEFMIGYPFLLLGFYLRSRLGGHFLPEGRGPLPQALRFVFHDARPYLFIGFIGPLSLVNTFCHAHTPLGVSLVRTFHGLWMGIALGGLLIAVLRWAEVRWKRLP